MRRVPFNYIILFVYTIAASIMVATITVFLDPKMILIAAIMTLGIFVGLTIFAFFIKSELTILRGLIFTSGMTLLIMIVFLIIMPNRYIFTIVCSVVVVIVSIYIIYDTRLIVGHSKYNSLSYDDYIIGAVLVYSDIITLFLWLLSLIGASNGNN